LPADNVKELLKVDKDGWKKEIEDVAANYAKFGNHLPAELSKGLDELRKRLK
jgi:phosphoenolpyruvate carboxykinase (GTP)